MPDGREKDGVTAHELESLSEEFLDTFFENIPAFSRMLGIHRYDGQHPPLSAQRIGALTDGIRSITERLALVRREDLSAQERRDARWLESFAHSIFSLLEGRREPYVSPMIYMVGLDYMSYVQRDYAPPAERAGFVISALEQTPAYLDAALENLDFPLARPFLQAGIAMYGGLVPFIETDLRQFVEQIGDSQLSSRFDSAAHAAVESIQAFCGRMSQELERAHDRFAIGADNYRDMMRFDEMVELPLDELLQIGEEDLRANGTRVREVVERMRPGADPREVMAELALDHPTSDGLFSSAQSMLEDIRQFLIDRDIVSVPEAPQPTVAPTPSFLRWSFASMWPPGPFEPTATEAYYYITPVEEDWTDEQKEEWLRRFNYPSLKNTSVHEVWPGHYLQFLHLKKSSASVLARSLFSTTFIEGWAHYTEQMMLEEGFGDGDPGLHLAQLQDALLRDVRYVVSIRMHTQGMTVEEATRMFTEHAYLEELPAQQEAMRGTFDPAYLNYTLGKLLILQLREDYKRQKGERYTLREFHDQLLAHGNPPVPLVREALLEKAPGAIS